MGKKSGIGSKKLSLDFDSLLTVDDLDLPDPINLLFSDTANITNDQPELAQELEQPEALIYRNHRPSKRELKTIASNEYLHQVLCGLPLPGVTWHAISNSRFNFWSFVPSVIAYLGNYTNSLYCATWTTNNLNTRHLIELFDAGRIGEVTFVVGKYFQTREQAVYNYLATNLLERNQRLVVGEHHLKVLLLQNEGNFIVVESSANLTSNPRTEQFTYSNDENLFHFYQEWFESVAQPQKKHKVA